MVRGPMSEQILIVEDKASHARMLADALESAGYEATIAGDVTAARRLLRSRTFGIVLTDLRLPDGTGIDVVESAVADDASRPILIMTAYGTIDEAVRAMKSGAVDFIQKPIDIEHLLALVERWTSFRRVRAENLLLREEAGRSRMMPVIVGDSAAIRGVAENVRRVAAGDTTVLLLGESGTGKELFARAIHELSPRRDRPFVAINCAAIPDTLLENELFGHEKGSYTGATNRQIGKFELASGGTVFLDEIAEMGAATQAKLLRVIQERTFERIGSTRTISADLRFVCATNRDLEAHVREGAFREDLYYRICVFPITIPPLRDRPEDIPLLARHIIQRLQRELGKPRLELGSDALDLLRQRAWPGNVRELQNALERAAILSDGQIRRAHFESGAEVVKKQGDLSDHGTLGEVTARAVERAERARIEAELPKHGTRAALAAALGINVRTLTNKLRQYGLTGREEDEYAE